MNRVLWGVVLASCVGVGGVGAQTAPSATAAEPQGWAKYVTPILSERLRLEVVDWFDPPDGAAHNGATRYGFLANQLRAGLKINLPYVQLVVEGQDVRLVNLPTDASLGAPYGNLGPGALYFAHTQGLEKDSDQGETILRQAYATVKDIPFLPGVSATGGRFEYADGAETVPADPAVAWLKKTRIAERLIGPFNYTHVGRSFDGGRLAWDQPWFNLTAIAARPTHGGFEISGSREMGDVGFAGLTATLKGVPGVTKNADFRLFYLGYEDDRFADERKEPARPTKVDNRPLADRKADTKSIRVHTVGGHALAVADAGPGRLDALAWGTIQAGDWGTQSHRAWAYAAEVGYQMPSWWSAPWLRVGVDQSSGDDDPSDNEHHTFFQLLPTARIYAQFPFFNMMNTQDFFGQFILKPHPKVTVRTDYHMLRLTERNDLWYGGGGATNDDLFGFSGIPANKHRELASLADIAVTVNILPQLTAYLYYGHAFGQGVVHKTFDGTQADYGYVELTYKY